MLAVLRNQHIWRYFKCVKKILEMLKLQFVIKNEFPKYAPFKFKRACFWNGNIIGIYANKNK